MNILASYNWIKEYLKTDLTPEDFARELSLKSMSVESIDYVKNRLNNFVVGDVKEVKDHPNADKLKIAVTDIGKETVEIVCGGNNLGVGMKVFVALPGSMVMWHGEGDLVELQKTKIRGVESYGMICSPTEVGFEKVYCSEGGIWDLTDMTDAEAGVPIVEALDMDDVIFDIEVTTNRPDVMSIVGLAREGSVVLEGEFDFKVPILPEGEDKKDLIVKVQDKNLCPHYKAVVINDVKVEPSPMWLQSKLLLAGHRSINNIVDITNYILHEYGQPLHSFDYDKLTDNKIIIRRAKAGERIVALNKKEYELSDNNLVIADSENPIAIAGVMGGEHSGTNEKTTTVVFEAAVFDSVSIRKTGRGLNLYSDSQLLFEKGLSTEGLDIALAKAIELTLEIAGGEVASEIIDVRKEKYQPLIFPLKSQKIRDLIGVEIEDKKIIDILTRLGFVVSRDGDDYQVLVPYWRDHDIETSIDFAEEVARIYGYHNIKATLPLSPQPNYASDSELVWESLTKKFLASCGYTEFYSYSFISVLDCIKYDLDSDGAIKIFNPLSEEFTRMRTSLIPSVLKGVELNQGNVVTGKIFELARIYLPRKNKLPEERTALVFGEYGVKNAEVAFLDAKGVLMTWADKIGLELKLERLQDNKYWHSGRSAAIIFEGKEVGTIGQVSDKYQNSFSIDYPVMLVNIDFQALVADMTISQKYELVPEFPVIIRDIAVVVDEKVEFKDMSVLSKQQSNLIRSINIVDTYRGQGIQDGKKSVTLSVNLRGDDRTLESVEADRVIVKVIDMLKDRFNAIIR